MNPILQRLKMQLKLAVSRLRMLQQRNESLAKKQRRDMADLIARGKHELARIKCEHLILEDSSLETMSKLELYCELLMARVQLFQYTENTNFLDRIKSDSALAEAVQAIFKYYGRCEVKELKVASEMLLYLIGGREIAETLFDSENGSQVTKIFEIKQPSQELIDKYFYEISKAYKVGDFEEDTLQPASEIQGDDSAIIPELPQASTVASDGKEAPTPASDSLDDLKARYLALKKS